MFNDESYFFFIIRVHYDPVVPVSIHEVRVLIARGVVNKLINNEQGVSVFRAGFDQISEIDAHPQFARALLNHDYIRRPCVNCISWMNLPSKASWFPPSRLVDIPSLTSLFLGHRFRFWVNGESVTYDLGVNPQHVHRCPGEQIASLFQ